MFSLTVCARCKQKFNVFTSMTITTVTTRSRSRSKSRSRSIIPEAGKCCENKNCKTQNYFAALLTPQRHH